MPYGDELPIGATEGDGKDRGLIFVALNATIERQFEFIQSEWMNYGNDFLQGNDKDPIVGNHDGTGKLVIRARRGIPALRHLLFAVDCNGS